MKLEKSPVVVAGMHRSGTSLVASIVSAVGIAMGEQLLAVDRNNPRGYWEDLDFLELDRRMLVEATLPDDGGHRDWGWTESERLDRDRFEEFREPAQALIAGRAGSEGRWGWKDPRTTLLLDFWDPLLGDPLYVFAYRFSWEVADSMQRLGADVFLRHPDYAYRIWTFYNRHLLDFHRRHRDRSLLVSTDALLRQPERLRELLAGRFGLDGAGAPVQEILDGELFQRLDGDDPLVSLTAATHPDCAALLAELDAAADLSAGGLWRAGPLAPARLTGAAEPRLAVVIPCFNHGEFLVEAVASVERGVPEPYELIVVNDGSCEPRTLEVLEILRRAGYRIVDQENSGLGAARNRGIEEARAPYILPLDADNRLRPGFIAPALQLLDEDPKVGVVYGDRRDFGMRNGFIDVPPFELDTLLPFNYIDACAVLRKEVWSACGGYDSTMPAWEDWDFWIGAAERGWQFQHLPGEAFDYRVRPDSMVSAMAEEAKRRRLYTYIISKHRDLYWQRLPELLLAAQRSAGDLSRLAREHERSAREHEDTQARAGAMIQNLTAQLANKDLEVKALRAERESSYRELAAWSERVAFMEGTRAWRLRQWIVGVKRALWRRSVAADD
jgi:glycosyltransferase involved in cell wall biosynthesis